VDRAEWNRRYAGSELLWSAAPNRFLVAEVATLPAGRALDLACGEGRSAIWLAERGWTVTGVDFSDVALEKAARLAEARGVTVEWLLADLCEYEPPPRAFELVVVLYLQLPADERRLVLRRAASAVAAGGTALVVAHHARNVEEGHGGPSDPRVLYTPEEVAADLEELEIVRADSVLRPVETPEGERTAIDVLVRARRPS
jgi:SAM-dependent methyltransferase